MWQHHTIPPYNRLLFTHRDTASLHVSVFWKVMKWQTSALMTTFIKIQPSLSSETLECSKEFMHSRVEGFQRWKICTEKATRLKNDGTLLFYPVYKVKRQISLTPLFEGLHIHLLFYIHWGPLECLLSFWHASMLFYEYIIGEWACSLCCGCTPAVSRRSNTNTTLRDKERVAESLWIGHSWKLKSDCCSRSS